MSELEYNFFISYKRNNAEHSEIVENLYKSLTNSGFCVFKDDHYEPLIEGGLNWKSNIYRAIEQSHYFLLFIDENYLDSDTTKYEIDTIQNSFKNRSFVVIVFDGTLNERIKASYPFLENSIFINNKNTKSLVSEIEQIYYDYINSEGK